MSLSAYTSSKCAVVAVMSCGLSPRASPARHRAAGSGYSACATADHHGRPPVAHLHPSSPGPKGLPAPGSLCSPNCSLDSATSLPAKEVQVPGRGQSIFLSSSTCLCIFSICCNKRGKQSLKAINPPSPQNLSWGALNRSSC